jgi:hypothetical protein
MNRIVPDDFEPELFNDIGFVIRAKADIGEDVHLWTFVFQLQGPEIIVDGDVTQTPLVYSKFSDSEKQYMRPNAPSVNKGPNIEDYFKPGTMKIPESDTKVTWELGGRLHICLGADGGASPKFHLGGDPTG